MYFIVYCVIVIDPITSLLCCPYCPCSHKNGPCQCLSRGGGGSWLCQCLSVREGGCPLLISLVNVTLHEWEQYHNELAQWGVEDEWGWVVALTLVFLYLENVLIKGGMKQWTDGCWTVNSVVSLYCNIWSDRNLTIVISVQCLDN